MWLMDSSLSADLNPLGVLTWLCPGSSGGNGGKSGGSDGENEDNVVGRPESSMDNNENDKSGWDVGRMVK